MASIQSLSVAQLKRALELREQIEGLEAQLGQLLGEAAPVTALSAEPVPPSEPRKKRGMSAAGRARIAAAQRARWARTRQQAGGGAPEADGSPDAAASAKPRRTMSPEAKARISAAAKKRWRKVKAAGRTRL